MGRSRSASTMATSETHQMVILKFKKNSIQEQRKEKPCSISQVRLGANANANANVSSLNNLCNYFLNIG
jgi:hypothetical protein